MADCDAMNLDNTMAGRTQKLMRDRLLSFSDRRGSVRAAASELQSTELSRSWLQQFAAGRQANATVRKLAALEARLIECEARDLARTA